MVSIFSFANGVLTQLPGLSRSSQGRGFRARRGQQRLVPLRCQRYAINPAPNLSTGNISGSTSIPLPAPDPHTRLAIHVRDGNGPSALAIDPAGQLVYAFTPDRASPSGVSPSITPVEPRTDRWWPQRALRSACRQAESSLCSSQRRLPLCRKQHWHCRLYLQSIERLSLGGHRVAVCTGNCARENGVLELEA